MSRFVTYTYLRIKAVMKIYPAMCIMTLFLCLSLGGMLYLQSERTEDLSGGDEDARISIGVVGTATSGYLDRADLFWQKKLGQYVSLAVQFRFYFGQGGYVGCQQLLHVSVDLDKITFKHKK